MTKTPEQIRRAHEMLDHIEAHPESHDQNWWVMGPDGGEHTAAQVLNECGTTACAAGWTVLLAGGVTDGGQYVRMPGDPWSRFIGLVATELLGLDLDEAHKLFHVADDLADVRKAVFEIFGPRPDGI